MPRKSNKSSNFNPMENSSDAIKEHLEDVETVFEQPTPWQFKEKGERLVGQYVSKDTVTPNEGDSFQVQMFRNIDSAGMVYCSGYQLLHYEFEPGEIYIITYVEDVDTGKGSNMKSYRISKATGNLKTKLADILRNTMKMKQ